MKRKSLPTGRDFLFVEGYGNENPGAFQPTRPLRGATAAFTAYAVDVLFQPTRPLRGATPTRATGLSRTRISTHAPLAGRDLLLSGFPESRFDFNPRAPCGARPVDVNLVKTIAQFQPTRPLRGATGGCQPGKNHSTISTHAPLAGRDEHRVDYLVRQLNFNPRAPCGARPSGPRSHRIMVEFQPTRPLRGATFFFRVSLKAALISTHAPLAGRD